MQTIKTALISVSDKSGIIDLAKFLAGLNIKIISTGGTQKTLEDNGISCTGIESHTNFPEMMDGRLKTLHPKVHGGLLGREQDRQIMQDHDIESIDLLIVNLYPFEEAVKSDKSDGECIENIDIGGPGMIRSAAKNFAYKAIICDPSNYTNLIMQLTQNNGKTDLSFRKSMAAKAFAVTGYYDSLIANWFFKDEKLFGYQNRSRISIPAKNPSVLRYGENPHQNAFFTPSAFGEKYEQIQGKELSYNNIVDFDVAISAAFSFTKPTVAIIKHASPCGIASSIDVKSAYDLALASDKTSAFGGIVASNVPITKEAAEAMYEHFFEVISAPAFDADVLNIFSKKKNLRILKAGKPSEFCKIRSVYGGFLVQENDSVKFDSGDFDLQCGKIEVEYYDLIFACTGMKFLKSNAILITSGEKFVSFGAGQTSRIDSMRIALEKLGDINRNNLILASDAFFPFSDNIELAAQYGIRNIVSPSGSIMDEEVIASAKKHNINLFFIRTRHFFH